MLLRIEWRWLTPHRNIRFWTAGSTCRRNTERHAKVVIEGAIRSASRSKKAAMLFSGYWYPSRWLSWLPFRREALSRRRSTIRSWKHSRGTEYFLSALEYLVRNEMTTLVPSGEYALALNAATLTRADSSWLMTPNPTIIATGSISGWFGQDFSMRLVFPDLVPQRSDRNPQ